MATFVAEIVLIVVIALILFLLYVIFKKILKLLMGIVINSILGLAAIYLLDTFTNMMIPLKLYTILIAALFGLPGVGTLVILRLFGIPLG